MRFGKSYRRKRRKMTTKKTEDAATVARAYIDEALKLQGGRASDEHYEHALASAETAFRRLADTRRKAAKRATA